MSSIDNHSTSSATSQENQLANLAKNFFEEIGATVTNKTNPMSNARIYRVPEELRKLNESAYTPRFVSIGPLHSMVKYLKPHMEEMKVSYVASLLGETQGEKDAVDILYECLKEMRNSITQAEQYYAEKVELDEKMLVTDGCFILEVLRRMSPINKKPGKKSDAEKNNASSNPALPKKDQSRSSDPICGIPLVLETVQQDLLLLENQLPFFVLEKLFDRTLARISNKHTLSDYVLSSFRGRLEIGDAKWPNSSYATNCGCPGDCVLTIGEGNNRPDHILHLLYNYYLGGHQSASEKDPSKSPTCIPCSASKKGQGLNESSKDMPSASDLANKGVKFKSCKNLFEVEFQVLGPCRGARFRIPTLYVDDSTEPILRNLIALEQCCPNFQLYFTSYADLMDRLVSTEKDVEELVGDELIHNSLGNNKEASRFFNNLCKGVITSEDLYSTPRSKAVWYSERSWYNIVPAIWTHIQCSCRNTPWTSIAFFIAFVSFGIALATFIRSYPW